MLNISGGIHPYFSALTILWMFTPFLLEISKWVVLIFLKKGDNWKEGLREAFVHFPLVVPLVNTGRTYRLCFIEYADPMSSVSLDEIEKIKMVAGKLTTTEAFTVRNNHSLICSSLQLFYRCTRITINISSF